MKHLVAVVALALAVVVGSTSCGSERDGPARGPVEANAVVDHVIDGDTIDVDIDGREERVRLIGINTPESVDPRRPVECFGKNASARLEELLPVGTRVRLERDVEQRDQFGRLLAYVILEDGTFINVVLVEEGFATQFTRAPNVSHADAFRVAERSARSAGRGLWSACDQA